MIDTIFKYFTHCKQHNLDYQSYLGNHPEPLNADGWFNVTASNLLLALPEIINLPSPFPLPFLGLLNSSPPPPYSLLPIPQISAWHRGRTIKVCKRRFVYFNKIHNFPLKILRYPCLCFKRESISKWVGSAIMWIWVFKIWHCQFRRWFFPRQETWL